MIYRLTYQELTNDKDRKDRVMAEIFTHLGLPDHQTTTKMRKQNIRDYADSILNYDEHEEYIKHYLKRLN